MIPEVKLVMLIMIMKSFAGSTTLSVLSVKSMKVTQGAALATLLLQRAAVLVEARKIDSSVVTTSTGESLKALAIYLKVARLFIRILRNIATTRSLTFSISKKENSRTRHRSAVT